MSDIHTTNFQQIQRQLSGLMAQPGMDLFLQLCASRIGEATEQVRRILLADVFPVIALCHTTEMKAVLPPAVGMLIDLAAEHECGFLRQLAQHCIEPLCETPDEYLTQYRATRDWLLAAQCQLSTEIWPEPHHIELADTKGYKGCKSPQ